LIVTATVGGKIKIRMKITIKNRKAAGAERFA
jgi:hypothetical protein